MYVIYNNKKMIKCKNCEKTFRSNKEFLIIYTVTSVILERLQKKNQNDNLLSFSDKKKF